MSESVTGESGIKEIVKEKYGAAALRVSTTGSSCCGASASIGGCDPITSNLYDSQQAQQIPRRSIASVARLWQSHGSGGTEARRDSA